MEERQTGSDTTSLASAALSDEERMREAFESWMSGGRPDCSVLERDEYEGYRWLETRVACDAWKAACEWAAAHITPEPGDDCLKVYLSFDDHNYPYLRPDDDESQKALDREQDGTRFHCFPILERGEGNSNG